MFESKGSRAILLLGGFCVVLPSVLPNPLVHGLSFSGVIYLLTAAGYELRGSPSLRDAVGIAAIGTLLVTLLRLQSVASARSELGTGEFVFVLFQPFVQTPFVVAVMAACGIAQDRTNQLALSGVLVVPFVADIYRQEVLVAGWGFGPMGTVVFTTGTFLVSAVIGLPLYLYARRFGLERSQ